MSSLTTAGSATKRAPIATLIIGLLVGVSALANGILTIAYAASDRFSGGVSYLDTISPGAINKYFDDTSDGIAFWQSNLMPLVLLLIGLLVGILALIGLLTRSRGISTTITFLGAAMVLIYAVSTVLTFALAEYVDANSYFFDADNYAFGLWTTLLAALALVLVVASVIAGIAGAGRPAAPAAIHQQPAAFAAAPTVAPAAQPAPAPTASPRRPFADLDGTYFIQVEGTEYGPYDAAQIATFADEGRIIPSSLIRPDGGFFQTADQAPGLF